MSCVELAKRFKNNENKSKIGAVIGKVITGGIDYKIGIMDSMVYLDSNNSKLCNSLRDRTEEVEIEMSGSKYISKIEYKNILKTGDSVLVIGAENNQFFYVVDKI